MMLSLAIQPWIPAVMTVVFVFVSVVMVLTVLIQRPQGGGLSGAFGSGAGSGQTAFGAKTGDALTIATIAIFIIYLGVAVALNYLVKPPAPVLPTAGPGPGIVETTPAAAPAPPVDGVGQPVTTEPAPADQPGETPLAPPANIGGGPAPVPSRLGDSVNPPAPSDPAPASDDAGNDAPPASDPEPAPGEGAR